MRSRRERTPGAGTGQLVWAELSQHGQQRGGLWQHDLGEGLGERRQCGALGHVAIALERTLSTRVNCSQQGAHITEEVQGLAASQLLANIRQQIARAAAAACPRTRLPLVLVLPPTVVRVPSALRHRWQPTDSCAISALLLPGQTIDLAAAHHSLLTAAKRRGSC